MGTVMAFSSEDKNDNIKVLDDDEDVDVRQRVRLITMATMGWC